MGEMTCSVAEARANFSKIASEVERTGEPVTVFKNSKPWVMIAPLAEGEGARFKKINWVTYATAEINE